jgi:hypothetical protein
VFDSLIRSRVYGRLTLVVVVIVELEKDRDDPYFRLRKLLMTMKRRYV